MLFVKIIIIFDMANINKIKTNVLFLSYFEKNIGINNPKIAIVNVNELTYNPDIAIVVLKYCEITEIIPTILKGVLIPRAEIVNIYKSSFGFFIITLLLII